MTSPTPTSGVAVASGITPAVAATWSPALVRSPRVLVPIQLSVLMVRDETLTWAQCGMQTPPAPDPTGGAQPVAASALLPPPFTDLDKPRARGAYLHWYLPNGLTAGTVDGEPSQWFPAIPDRWVVLRLSGGQDGARRAVRGWVIEAGTEPPVVQGLAGWTDPGSDPTMVNPLTALGHGDLTWAGYFDNVENRLGFHDATLDDDNVVGSVSYLVCGWYEDPTRDPLGASTITSPAGFNATMARLGLGLDTGPLPDMVRRAQAYVAAAGTVGLQTAVHANMAVRGSAAWEPLWPTAMVLHGSVIGINWPDTGDSVEVGGPPDPASITVAIGNTMGETLGALVARANGAPGEAAIVEALQLGVISELDAPDGRARLDSQVHASSFVALSGGDAKPEAITIAPSGPPPAPASPPAGPDHVPIVGGRQTGGVMKVAQGNPPVVQSEAAVIAGGLREVLSSLGIGVTVPPTDPGGEVDAMRALPRFYLPKDPVLLVQGGKRAFVHDSSVFTEDGVVQCRLAPVTELSWLVPGVAERLAVGGADILASGVDNGSVPPECQALLAETALLDPGAAPAMVAAVGASVPATAVAAAVANVTVEQTVWHALRDPRIDFGPLLAHSGIAGVLPAAFAIAPATQPWTPLHLDWSVEYLPSPHGVDDWQLGETDFALMADATIPEAGTGLVVTGGSTVTGGASATLASAVRNALAQAASVAGASTIPTATQEAFFSVLAQRLTASFQDLQLEPANGGDPLGDIATALGQMDVLSCGLDGLLTQLRGGVPGDGSVKDPVAPAPTPFVALRGGFLRVVRLRLVDGYGQFVDLCGSDAAQPARGVVLSEPLAVAASAEVAGLPPRFSAQSRVTFRFMSADQPDDEADATTSPLCGFLMPNHLDGTLEFFNADGSNAGTLEPRPDRRAVWQAAPGSPTTAGSDPGSTLGNEHAAAIVRSLVDWGITDAGAAREPALGALLRTIDSTRWAVDPFGHVGDEHLALLLGHPVCVVRALLKLEVIDPVAMPDTTVTAVPIRLGALAQWQDGLLGYFADDDYTLLHVSDAAAAGMARPIGPQQGFLQPINAVPGYYETFSDDLSALAPGSTTGATPVAHPYVDTSGVIWVRPNQTVPLTLLVEPMTTVHATAGLVPRKEIGLRRAWVQAGLAAIAPTFQFGPVLVDPQHIRMPLATELNGTWFWDYRSDATTWSESPATNATDDALLSRDPQTAIEGWLRLSPPTTGSSS